MILTEKLLRFLRTYSVAMLSMFWKFSILNCCNHLCSKASSAEIRLEGSKASILLISSVPVFDNLRLRRAKNVQERYFTFKVKIPYANFAEYLVIIISIERRFSCQKNVHNDSNTP